MKRRPLEALKRLTRKRNPFQQGMNYIAQQRHLAVNELERKKTAGMLSMEAMTARVEKIDAHFDAMEVELRRQHGKSL